MLTTLFTALMLQCSFAQTPPTACENAFNCGRYSGQALYNEGGGDAEDVEDFIEIRLIAPRSIRFSEQTYLPGGDELTKTSFELTIDADQKIYLKNGANVSPQIGSCERRRCTFIVKGAAGTTRMYVLNSAGPGLEYIITEHAANRKTIWLRQAYLGPN